jgi:hypothetical protein
MFMSSSASLRGARQWPSNGIEEDAAEKLFTATFEKWRTNAEIGYHGCHSAKETEEYVRRFFSAGFSESPTAKAIMQYVEVSPQSAWSA